MTNGTHRADYISDITSDLAKMAREDGLNMLSFILEMAKMEADRHAQWTGRAEPAIRSVGEPAQH